MALIGTLTSGVSALKAFSTDLEVIGNNIANVNTIAYKSNSVNFANNFSNTIASLQIGTGSKVSSIDTDFTQGSLEATGSTTDLGISGEGYFLVKDTASNEVYATRAGNFHWDDDGYLVTANGLHVQGIVGDPATSTTTGDIKKDETAIPTGSALSSVSIDSTGSVVQYYADGTNSTVGQVLLQQFRTPSSLSSEGDGLYSKLANAGPVGTDGVFTTAANVTAISDYQAGSSGNGKIESGKLESSNVDLTEQFSALITAQRSFQAASRVVTVSDTVLEDIVNLKR
jgi:flagellar hook protein FlgE